MPRRTSIRIREGSQSTQSTQSKDSEISNVEGAVAEVDFTDQEGTVGPIQDLRH